MVREDKEALRAKVENTKNLPGEKEEMVDGKLKVTEIDIPVELIPAMNHVRHNHTLFRVEHFSMIGSICKFSRVTILCYWWLSFWSHF